MRRLRAIRASIPLAVLAAGLHGCAAIPLAVVAGSLLEAGGGMIVKTGTEYTASGAARRTFNLPVEQVHAAVLETFRRTQISITRDEAAAERHRIAGRARHRTVRVDLVALTPVLTTMELAVKRNVFASDKATASELLAATEHVLAESAVVASAPGDVSMRKPTACPQR